MDISLLASDTVTHFRKASPPEAFADRTDCSNRQSLQITASDASWVCAQGAYQCGPLRLSIIFYKGAQFFGKSTRFNTFTTVIAYGVKDYAATRAADSMSPCCRLMLERIIFLLANGHLGHVEHYSTNAHTLRPRDGLFPTTARRVLRDLHRRVIIDFFSKCS